MANLAIQSCSAHQHLHFESACRRAPATCLCNGASSASLQCASRQCASFSSLQCASLQCASSSSLQCACMHAKLIMRCELLLSLPACLLIPIIVIIAIAVIFIIVIVTRSVLWAAHRLHSRLTQQLWQATQAVLPASISRSARCTSRLVLSGMPCCRPDSYAYARPSSFVVHMQGHCSSSQVSVVTS